MGKTNIRGFEQFGEGVDTHGFQWTVRESSLVGEPHCWLFIQGNRSRSGALHLHYTQVQRLVEQLARFPDPLGMHSYGTGTGHHGITWELSDASTSQPRLGMQVEGVLKGKEPKEERTINGRLVLSVEQAAALQLHLRAFLHSMFEPVER